MDKNIILDLDNTLICNNTPRPHLKCFLDFVFSRFNKVCIWTSATKEWLDNAYINLLKPNLPANKDFYFMWHREHCNVKYVLLENNILNIIECHKELRLVYSNYPEFNENNTLIVDDNYSMFSTDIHNGVLIEAFEENKTFDIELYRLSVFLHYEILKIQDVRSIDKLNWKQRCNVLI